LLKPFIQGIFMKQNRPSLINGYAKEPVESNVEKKHTGNQEHKDHQFKNQRENHQTHSIRNQDTQETKNMPKKSRSKMRRHKKMCLQ